MERYARTEQSTQAARSGGQAPLDVGGPSERWDRGTIVGARDPVALHSGRSVKLIYPAEIPYIVDFQKTEQSGKPPRRSRSRVVTIDKSLRRKGRLARSRNVLKREERIAVLQADERWPAGRSPLGLPKVRIAKTSVAKKKKKKTKEEADTTTAAETTSAAGAKAAPGGKTAGAGKSAPAKSPGKK